MTYDAEEPVALIVGADCGEHPIRYAAKMLGIAPRSGDQHRALQASDEQLRLLTGPSREIKPSLRPPVPEHGGESCLVVLKEAVGLVPCLIGQRQDIRGKHPAETDAGAVPIICWSSIR